MSSAGSSCLSLAKSRLSSSGRRSGPDWLDLGTDAAFWQRMHVIPLASGCWANSTKPLLDSFKLRT
jgi:hypothetical protein